MFVTPGLFFIISIWELVSQDFYSQFPKILILKKVQWYWTPRDVNSFVMSYDSRGMNFGEIETMVLYNQFREMYIFSMNTLYNTANLKASKI